MAAMHIPSACLLTFGDKLTLYIPEGKISPFKKMSRTVDIILMFEKDYEANLHYIRDIVGEKTKIFFI
jgi:hypothetical protein